MDAQAERRHQQLKRKLDALRYNQPLSFESTALTEKLLNDYLKATEAFNKLKKMNDQLKNQVGSETQYQEPLKKENERIINENNQLHQTIIQLKEIQSNGSQNKDTQFQQLKSENDDLQFLQIQKDNKIKQLDLQVMEMRQKLNEAIQATSYQKSSEIQKVFSNVKDINDYSASFELTQGLNSNLANNNADNNEISKQKEIWAQELRKADERSDQFKNQLNEIEFRNQQLQNQVNSLNQKIDLRDQEISRLNISYQGGQALQNVKESSDIEKQSIERQKLIEYFEDMANIIDMPMFRLDEGAKPLNFELVQQIMERVLKLKSQIDDFQQDKNHLETQIEQLRSTNFNEANMGKMISDQEAQSMRQNIQDLNQHIQDLQQKNVALQGEMERKENYQSAFQSNNKAIIEKIEIMENQKVQKDNEILQVKQQLKEQIQNNDGLKNEVNYLKGRTTNLTRDIELHSDAVNKLSSDHGNMGEQIGLYKQRIDQLEEELSKTSEDNTNNMYEVKRLSAERDSLHEQLQKTKIENIQKQGESQTSGATLGRIQQQLESQKKDYELIYAQKIELERIIKKQKIEIIDGEKKCQDQYDQLISTKQNFQILHNEQKLLSDELTQKQQALTNSEREKMNQERELLMLRPLQNQLQNFSEANQSQIESNVKNEFEKNKLSKELMNLKNEYDRLNTDHEGVNQKHNELIVQNQRLIEQLKYFEKESFEIEARIKRSNETQNENTANTQTIQQLKDNERDKSRQIDNLNQQLVMKSSELDRLNGKLETVTSYNITLEKEISESRMKMQGLNNDIHNEQNVQISKQHQSNQQEVQIYDMRKQNELLQNDNKHKDEELRLSRNNLQEQESKVKILNQQLDRLKSLVENLDQNKEELIKRLQNNSKEMKFEESDKAILQNDIQMYKREMLGKDQEIQDLKQSIASLDGSIDDIQQELDNKTEELIAYKSKMDKQIFEFSNMQHQVSVIAGKEDDFQRRLYERENEIKILRQENGSFREQLESSAQIIQVKTQECQELVEDIQTLTKENKFVNQEFSKSTQANEFLKKQNETVMQQERIAVQNVRALEMEKQDILQNYRDQSLELERCQESIKSLSDDHNNLYQRGLDMEKNMGGSQFMIKELQQKEQNYIAEIKTLERHIDHLTHQLELAHKAMKETQSERDKLEVEINNFRQMNHNQENNQEGLQRMCAQYEQDKTFQNQQVNDLKIESSALRQQIDLDKEQIQGLELLIQNERQFIHEAQFKQKDLAAENQVLNTDLDRQTMKVQSLQKHIDTLQRYSGSSNQIAPQSSHLMQSQSILTSNSMIGEGFGADDLRQAHETIEKLRNENEQSQKYIQQYENQINILETEVNELGKQQD